MLKLRSCLIITLSILTFLFLTNDFFDKNIHLKDSIITYTYAASSNQHSQLPDPRIQNVS